MSEHEVELTGEEQEVLCICSHAHDVRTPEDNERLRAGCDEYLRIVQNVIAARLADAEARAEAARLEVERGIAQFEVLASKMRNYPSTNDHAPIAGYTISADDWRAVRAHLREALRGDQ